MAVVGERREGSISRVESGRVERKVKKACDEE
jgi:hypothetical protein